MSNNRKQMLEETALEMNMPEKITQAGVEFIREDMRQREFRLYIANLHLMVIQRPQFVVNHELQLATPTIQTLREGLSQEAINETIYRGYFFEPHQRVVEEMLFCKIIDNWLTYISQVLALIFTTRPEALKSSEQVRIDYILQFKDTETLIAALAERKVEKLAFLGIRELANFFAQELGFVLVEDNKSLDSLIEAVEIRNAIVHARGYISKIFLNRLPNYPGKVGELIKLGDIAVLENRLFVIAMDIDKRAATKWSIPCIPLKRESS